MNTSPVIHTLADLVSINSVNPAYDCGAPEAEIAQFVESFFTDHGIDCWRQEVFPDRPNLIACLPGRSSSRRIVFEAHSDTASISGMDILPFHPEVSGGRLYGRGACDTKAGLAAMMHALVSLKRAGETPPCEVWVVATAEEEYCGAGVRRLCKDLRAQAAIVSEPTAMSLVVASKGCLRWRIWSLGRAAHSSKPHLGVNAITKMVRVISALEADAEHHEQTQNPLVGRPTLNIGIVRGGTQVNVVPDSCYIEVDRRMIPQEDPLQVLGHYEALLAGLRDHDSSLQCRMDAPLLCIPPFEASAEASVTSLASQVLQELGLKPERVGVPFGSDASELSRVGIPTILIGPGCIDQAHAAVEYVDCDQVEQAVEFYRRCMLLFE